MGVTNFDNLPQNIVESRLREMKQLEREQKGSMQRTTGNNLRYFIVDNPGEFAWSGKLPTHPTSEFFIYGVELEVTLTSENQEFPFTDLAFVQYTSNNGTDWYEAPYYPNYSDPNDREITCVKSESKGQSVTPFKSKWHISMSARQSTWLALKLQALSTDKVTLSIVRES